MDRQFVVTFKGTDNKWSIVVDEITSGSQRKEVARYDWVEATLTNAALLASSVIRNHTDAIANANRNAPTPHTATRRDLGLS